MTDTVKSGDTIKVNYTGRFEDGETFDSSEGREPLKFTVGTGQLIKGFDDAVVDMKVGDKKTVTIAPADGYGERNDDLVIDLPLSTVPEEMKLSVGMQLHLTDPNGNPVPAVVAEIGEETVKMDVNHMLAGKTLVFDIELVETGLTPDPPSACGGGSCGSSCGSSDPQSGCGCATGGGCEC